MPDLCIRVCVDQEVKKKKTAKKMPKNNKDHKGHRPIEKKKTSMRPRTF